MLKIRTIAEAILPSSALRRIRRWRWGPPQSYGERSADWYDDTINEGYLVHYSQSPYYFLWTVLLDRLIGRKPNSVLEIGCGTGQLACLLYESNVLADYRGLDFSSRRIGIARNTCPDLTFCLENALESNLYETFKYEVVISTEFLEHVEGDLDIIEKIKSGTLFLGSVPNYPWTSHVRHFKEEDEVLERYCPYFKDLKITPLVKDEKSKVIYILQGIRG